MDRHVPADMTAWLGRVDSTENYDAFRWHQWIRNLEFAENNPGALGGKLGFALIGFCCDEGTRRNQGRIGAAKGPEAIRKELANLPCSFAPEVLLFDAGNITCQDGDLEKSQTALADAVTLIRQKGLFPIVMGGGHELALGHYRGHINYYQNTPEPCDIGIVNFDAHFDLRRYSDGGNSGTMFRQIADQAVKESQPFKYLCIGIQKYSNTLELFKTADELGVEYLLAKEIVSRSDWYAIERIDEFLKSAKYIYLTICADVFSSAFAPGVSATQPLGLNPEEVIKYIKHIVRSEKVIGFDIAEISPRFDQDSTTASLAKVLIFSIVNTICRMKGLDR